MTPRLILGSGSPRRLDLLATLGIVPDDVRPPDIGEDPLADELPRPYCARIARAKVLAVAADAEDIVLCADTTVALGRRILGKPADAGEAAAFLKKLGGRRHSVITSVAVRRGERVWQREVVSQVRMKRLPDNELNAYLASGDWQGKAGGYGIQGPAGAFIPWISGSFTGIVGLPLAETAALLQAAGLPVWEAGTMKGRSILLDHLAGREAAALLVDGQLDDLLVAGGAPPPGTVYRARAERPVKGQGGMFLATPDGPAFLRQIRGLAPGDLLLVQVSGYAEPGKAIPVTAKLLFKSRYAIVTPDAPGFNVSRAIRAEDERDRLLEIARETMSPGAGLILRSAAAGADAEAIAEDIAAMAALAQKVAAGGASAIETLVDGDAPHALAWREWSAPADVAAEDGCFAARGILERIAALRAPEEALPGGGHVFIEPTRALVAVDVNTGRDTSPAAALKANLACARALPRVLRLRGLGGQIAIDPAPMPKKDRSAFESALRAAFRSDPEETALAGWTPLGHFELQRKRGRLPLHEVMQ